MGSLFRSEEMTRCQLFLNTDSAYACISQLGELGAIEFIDMIPDKNAFQKKFVNEVRRCDEMERKLRYLNKEVNLDGVPILNTGENPLAPEPREMIDMETNLDTLEEELKEINNNFEQLKKNFFELVELNYLLQKTKDFFEGVDSESLVVSQSDADVNKAEDRTNFDNRNRDNYKIELVAGVINREKLIGFERMLWRVCRGNVLMKFSDIDVELEDLTSVTSKKVPKSVFAVFFQGEQLKIRVNRICEAYHATTYPCTDNPNERKDMIHDVMTRMNELKVVLDQTQNHRHNVLVSVAKHIRIWFIKVSKIKAIYHILNLFDVNVTDKCMIGECWCPVSDMDAIYTALRHGMDKSNGTVQPIINKLGDSDKKFIPPTFNRVNKFTAAFQSLVDAYGVASYREINPAPFTVITFPFIFAIMFGDCGHGLIMFLFALALVLREKRYMNEKSDNEIWNMFFGGRYIILLMGLFSVYTGLIYNDAFSKSLNFGSSWRPSEYDNSTISANSVLQIDPNNSMMYFDHPYPFGIDSVWQSSSNKITFTNSLKMKMSIIIGISQMLFGVFLSVINQIFFNDILSIFTNFIPQIIFLLSIFGYLVFEIFAKWIMFDASTSTCAPQLLIGLINMFMFKKYKSTDPCADKPFLGDNAQYIIQSALIILAVICIPWMLLIKPFVLYHRHQSRLKIHKDKSVTKNLLDAGHENRAAEMDVSSSTEIDHSVIKIDSGDHDKEEEDEEEFEIGELFVHQCIHTIEYCLGCISNTASYLRLWALSLAHAQLSEVLWNMVLRNGLGMKNFAGCIVVFFLFAAWACLTIAVLLLMEGLSAFLHALRLHWVEFQNKYYKGEGYKFAPFNFNNVDNLENNI